MMTLGCQEKSSSTEPEIREHELLVPPREGEGTAFTASEGPAVGPISVQ